MKNFSYLQPRTLNEAGKMLKSNSEAHPFAGGTDLLDLVKHDVIAPADLVNLKNIQGLDKIEKSDGGLKIGSMVKLADLAENKYVAEMFPILQQAAKEVASPQLRNMGTVGGNICQRPRCWYYREDFNCLRKGGDICYAYDGENKYHCVTGGGPCYIVHPSDLAVAMLALNAKIKIVAGKEEKTIPVNEFFVLPEDVYTKENILLPGELVAEIFIPELPAGAKGKFVKFKERDVWDFAVVSVALMAEMKDGKITRATAAFGGLAPVPWTDDSFNEKLAGLNDTKDIKKITDSLLTDAEPLDKNSYKITLTQNLLRGLLEELL